MSGGGRCDIDEVTLEELKENDGDRPFGGFVHKYVLSNRPVIVRGGAAAWPAMEKWKKASLAKSLGKHTCIVGPQPYPELFGLEARNVSVREYMDSMNSLAAAANTTAVDYIFGSSVPEALMMEFAKGVPIRKFKDKAGRPMQEPAVELFDGTPTFTPLSPQIFLGPAYTGSPIHYHGQAINIQAYGRKRWFLYRPEDAMYRAVPVHQYLTEEWPDLPASKRPMECEQRAGDIIFVPSLWGHGVINLEESVGLALEFRHAWNMLQ